MASTFKSATLQSVGTTPTTIYTAPSVLGTTIIGLTLCNRTAAAITVNVTLTKSGGSLTYLLYLAPVPVGGSLAAFGGDEKLVMQTGDVLAVTSNTASSLDATISYLELT